MYKKKHYLCIRKLTKASGTGLTLNTKKNVLHNNKNNSYWVDGMANRKRF